MIPPSVYQAAKTLLLTPSCYWGCKQQETSESLHRTHEKLFAYIEQEQTDFDRMKTLIALIESKSEQLTYLDNVTIDIIRELELLTLTD